MKVPVSSVTSSLPEPGQREVHTDIDQDTDSCSATHPQGESFFQDTNLTKTQFEKLTSFYSGYPKTLYKNALLTLYASCDKKLSEVRQDLFVILTQKDDLPYRNCYLKRRVQKQTGDSIAEKLAYDIYTLVSALVEGDYNSQDIKDNFSTRHKSVTASGAQPSPSCNSSTPIRTPSVQIRHTDHPSRSEFQHLSDDLSMFKAESLTLKQNICATETERSIEINELKEVLEQVSVLLQDLKTSVFSDFQKVSESLSRMETVELNTFTQFKRVIKLMKQDIKNCESNIDIMEKRVEKVANSSKTSASRDKRSPSHPHPRPSGSTAVVGNMQAASEPPGMSHSMIETSQIEGNTDKNRSLTTLISAYDQSDQNPRGHTFSAPSNEHDNVNCNSLSEFPALVGHTDSQYPVVDC